MADRKPLKPAKPPSGEGRAAYGPRLPWKWIALGFFLLALLIAFFWIRHNRTVKGLRANIRVARNETVAPAAERIRRFRSRLEAWILEAADGGKPEPWADPELSFGDLHDEEILYLRIPAEAATDSEEIAEAARAMGQDAIGRCLGLTPTSLRGLYTRLEMLDPAWMTEVETADGTMRLRVLEDELTRYIGRDLPILLNMLDAGYFLLVLEHGPDRSKAPVDVYLWNLDERRLVLKTRARGKGLLLPVRINMGDAPRPPGKPPVRSGGAVDCSIAAQIRGVTGDEAMAVGDRAAARLEAEKGAREDGEPAAESGTTEAPESKPATETGQQQAAPSSD